MIEKMIPWSVVDRDTGDCLCQCASKDKGGDCLWELKQQYPEKKNLILVNDVPWDDGTFDITEFTVNHVN